MHVLFVILTFVASFMGTIVGFGSSIMMLPIVAILLPLPEALLFVGIVHFFNDVWEVVLFRESIKWKPLLIFGGTGIVATVIGASLVVVAPQVLLSRILGLLLIGSVLILLFNPKLELKQNTFNLSLGGTLSGFIAGIFGIGGPTRSLFLSSLKLSPKTYIFTIGALSLLVDAARLSTYLVEGVRLEKDLIFILIYLVPISFIAARLARSVVNKLPQGIFRGLVAVLLITVGLKFLLFP